MTHDAQDTRRYHPGDLPNTLEPGAVLCERYRLESEIGRGGMGVVFRATDLQLKREVAVKVLPGAGSSVESRERLMREARSAAALNHPNVVSVHDVGEDHGTPFFVMELVPGSSLGDAPPRTLQQAVDYAIQICLALEHAHGQGVVHRDLKPDNLLLSGSNRLKLADLGLAVAPVGSRITRAGSILGTAAYMAPEQALGREVDGRADLYALGVMLYEWTAGRLPFVGHDPLAVVSQHIHAPVVPPCSINGEIPDALNALILGLLAKEPQGRPASATEVAAALRVALTENAGTAPAAMAILGSLTRGRLVGRDQELAEARLLWRRALDGKGHCVLISGEPGAGKTRLGRELLVQASLDGAAVLTGACYEFEATTPYLPFVEAFRNWMHEQSDERLRTTLDAGAPQLAKLVPELAARIGPFPARAELGAQEERLLFADAVALAFQSIAESSGLVFYVDDLHWADSSSLWLLGRLLRQLRESKVLILCSYRETELARVHPLGKALVDWNRERLTTRIFLQRFDVEATQAQLEVLLGDAISREFAVAVHRETEGNPFFIEEVLKELIERGKFVRKNGTWEKPKTLELRLPQSMKEAIGHRLDRLSEDCNDALRTAAVIGKTFGFEELAAASPDATEDALLDALDEAVASQVVVANRDERFAFTHDKIREVLYTELNPIRRRRLHKRVAEGLETLKGINAPGAEVLAHHFIEAGDYEQGLEFARRAAQEAERVHAHDEAAVALRRARDCADALERRDEQAAIEESLGDVIFASGDSMAAAAAYERALLHMEPSDHRMRVQLAAARAYVNHGDPRGLTYARQASSSLDPAQDPIRLAQALSVEGRFHHLAGQHTKAREALERAVTLVDQQTDPRCSQEQLDTLYLIYAYLAGANQHLALFLDADVWAGKCRDLGKQHNMPVAESLGYEFLSENSINKGTWEEALEYVRREREIALRINSRDRLGWSSFVGGVANHYLGRFEAGREAFHESLNVAQAIGEPRLECFALSFLSNMEADAGNVELALTQAHTVKERADTIGLVYGRADSRRCLAHAHWRAGMYPEAVNYCQEVFELVAGIESRVVRLWTGHIHVESLMALGRLDEARRVLATHAELAAQCQSEYVMKRADDLRVRLEKN